MTVSLKANASLLDVVMLGAGAAIGSSIFSVLGPAARLAGSSLLWAIGAAMLPMAILAVVYAFVASAAPRSGASYEWPREFIGPRFAFGIAWLRILSSTGYLVTGALVLAHYLALFTPLPPLPTMLGVLTAAYALNLLGVSFAAKAQTVMMAILLLSFAAFVALAQPHVQTANLLPLWHGGSGWAILVTLPLLIHLFMGIETATEIGEEVHDAPRAIPRGILLSVLLTLVVYLVITATALGLIGIDGVAVTDTPLARAATAANPRIATPLIIGAALLCLGKSINVNFLIFARNLFAMGRSGILPAPLASVHRRFGTPHVAATVVYALSCAGLLLPQNLVYLFVATSVPTLLKYLSSCLCAIVIVRRHPELAAHARFRLPRRVLLGFAAAGAFCAAGIAAIGLETDWRPYVLIVAWTAMGMAYWLWHGRCRPVDGYAVDRISGLDEAARSKTEMLLGNDRPALHSVSPCPSQSP